MEKRYIMRIELSGPAKKKLAEISDRHGMTQVAMMSRLVDFFSTRDEQLQSAMLGCYPPEIAPKIQRLILNSL